jgi:long-chain fatty acid transport protein
MAEIQLFNFNPTIAAKFFDDKLSIAVGFDYTMGSVEMLKEANNFYPPANVHLEAGLTDGSGYGYNFGIQYKPTPCFNLGVSYRSPIDVEIEGDATFSENRSLFPEGKVKSTLKLPANIFIGAAFSPVDNLWFEFDAQFIGWSAFDKLELEFQKDNSVSVIEKRYKDTWILRFGAEYRLFNALTLSCGVFRDLNPVPDETLDPMLPDSDRWGINLGISYRISKMLSFDIAYMFLPFDERTTTVQELGFNGTYNTLTHLAGFNINFEF